MMKENELEQIRQQYLRRAISIIVRSSDYDFATACSLDILCDVGILYMQSLFSQVHAYAEHATRTRPNMNDVGRALEQRRVTVPQLDAYYQREATARSQAPVSNAVEELLRQAGPLSVKEPAADALLNGESSVFFADNSEKLLRKLVEYQKSIALEQRSKERLAKMAKTGSANGTRDSATQDISNERNEVATVHPSVQRPGRPAGERSDIGAGRDQEEEEVDDDDEAEEDADFVAPETSLLHIQPIPPEIASSSSIYFDEHSIQLPAMDQEQQGQLNVEGSNADADTPQLQGPTDAVAAQSKKQNGDEAEREHEHEHKHETYELELALLPPKTLPEYIPAQCPPLPGPYTYRETPVFPRREQDLFRTRIHKAEQSRQAEENLQRLISGAKINSDMPDKRGNSIRSPAPAEPKDMPSANASGKNTARQRIQNLFPPANFRNVYKRPRDCSIP